MLDPIPETAQRPWTSRKFWTAMFWQSVFTALLVKAFVTPEIYSTLTLITLGGFFAANVMSKKYGGQ